MTDAPLPPPPPAVNDSVRRVQIGVGGVVAVLLLIGLAQIITERSADEAAKDPATASALPATAPAEPTAEQPLIDLGVQPETATAEAPSAAPPSAPETAVPDLAPDPALDPARRPAP